MHFVAARAGRFDRRPEGAVVGAVVDSSERERVIGGAADLAIAELALRPAPDRLALVAGGERALRGDADAAGAEPKQIRLVRARRTEPPREQVRLFDQAAVQGEAVDERLGVHLR